MLDPSGVARRKQSLVVADREVVRQDGILFVNTAPIRCIRDLVGQHPIAGVKAQYALVAVIGKKPASSAMGEGMGETFVVIERHAVGIKSVALHEVRRIDEQQEFLLDPDRSAQLGDPLNPVAFGDLYAGAQTPDRRDALGQANRIPPRSQMPSPTLILAAYRPDTRIHHARTRAPVNHQRRKSEIKIINRGTFLPRGHDGARHVPGLHVRFAAPNPRGQFLVIGDDCTPERRQGGISLGQPQLVDDA